MVTGINASQTVSGHQLYVAVYPRRLPALIVGETTFVYVIPGIIHFCAYILALYVYRFADNEHLQNLVERVADTDSILIHIADSNNLAGFHIVLSSNQAAIGTLVLYFVWPCLAGTNDHMYYLPRNAFARVVAVQSVGQSGRKFTGRGQGRALLYKARK